MHSNDSDIVHKRLKIKVPFSSEITAVSYINIIILKRLLKIWNHINTNWSWKAFLISKRHEHLVHQTHHHHWNDLTQALPEVLAIHHCLTIHHHDDVFCGCLQPQHLQTNANFK